ncbi:hypothetical protein JTB14_018913 [Gonioctena quinquepunctata]|nr:hypothetical protein JTB14_018913 [Gonioctena quinquepunctata]
MRNSLGGRDERWRMKKEKELGESRPGENAGVSGGQEGRDGRLEGTGAGLDMGNKDLKEKAWSEVANLQFSFFRDMGGPSIFFQPFFSNNYTKPQLPHYLSQWTTFSALNYLTSYDTRDWEKIVDELLSNN